MALTEPIESKKIVHFCKDCREIVDVRQVGRKHVYTCKKCGTKNVAFGTEVSIREFYRVQENEGDSKPRKPKKDIKK